MISVLRYTYYGSFRAEISSTYLLRNGAFIERLPCREPQIPHIKDKDGIMNVSVSYKQSKLFRERCEYNCPVSMLRQWLSPCVYMNSIYRHLNVVIIRFWSPNRVF